MLTTNLNYTPGTFLIDDPDFGFQMFYAQPGTINLAAGTYTPTTTGSSAFFQSDTGEGSSNNGFYRDANANAILESNEFFTFGTNPPTTPPTADPRSNVYLRITADIVTVVPEPATAGLLGVAGLGLLTRRRRA